MAVKKHKVKYSTLPKLMWGKYAYAVVINCQSASIRISYSSPVIPRMSASMRKLVLAELPANSSPDDLYRITKGYSAWRIYFNNKTSFEKFNNYVLTNCPRQVIEIISPQSDDHVQVLKSDEKVVYRSQLFYNRYSWKITLSGTSNETERLELLDWVSEYFTDQIDISRVKLSVSYISFILYCNDEDDVAMTRLMYSHRIKNITHAIVVNPNNNNNTGTTHASSTLPPSS